MFCMYVCIVENIFRWALEGEYNIMTRRGYFGGFEGDNKNSVVFTNKRSQAKVYTMYFGISSI